MTQHIDRSPAGQSAELDRARAPSGGAPRAGQRTAGDPAPDQRAGLGPPVANRGGNARQAHHENGPDGSSGPKLHTDPEPINGPTGRLFSKGLDAFTFTASSPALGRLLEVTEWASEGNPRAGFFESEERICHGGRLWRRWNPRVSSKRWGLDYESWETTGAPSKWLAVNAPPGSRPSRIDIAFDHYCSDDLTPGDVLAPMLDEKGRTVNRSEAGPTGRGEEKTWTWYACSPDAPRRIRIYRKDIRQLQLNPADEFAACTPLMRFELVLRDEHAQAFYAMFLDDSERAYRAAASHIEQITGLQVHDLGEVPELAQVPATSAERAALELLYQHGPTLRALFDAGVDLEALSGHRVTLLSRDSEYRHRRRVRELAGLDPRELFVRLLRGLDQRASPVGA